VTAEMGSSKGPDQEFDAIVLAGGAARRMGGVDKTALEIDGVRILDRVVAGLADASTVSIVGPEVSGGPVAAIASALPRLEAPVVVTLAGDQPWIGPAVPLLVDGLADADVAVLAADGRRHYLAAAWRTSSLRAAIDALDSPVNAPVRALLEGRAVIEVPDTGGWSRDVDSPADLPG
jgi:molybdopterin-guanine dinucleotide biosynthesis protein A